MGFGIGEYRMSADTAERAKRQAHGLWDAAARTIMEAPAFRVRLGIARPGAGLGRTAPIQETCRSHSRRMVRQHGGGSGKVGARRTAASDAAARRAQFAVARTASA